MKTALIALTAALGLSTAAAAMTPHSGAASTLTPRDNVQIDAAHFSDTVLSSRSVDADEIYTPRDQVNVGERVSVYSAGNSQGNTQQTPR